MDNKIEEYAHIAAKLSIAHKSIEEATQLFLRLMCKNEGMTQEAADRLMEMIIDD